jgi:hypothetical protein
MHAAMMRRDCLASGKRRPGMARRRAIAARTRFLPLPQYAEKPKAKAKD